MVRSKKMLSAARDQACVNCGARDATVVAAHYSGLRSFGLGRGTGHKCHDIFVADLCHRCHTKFDGYHEALSRSMDIDKKIDLSEQFLYLICQTMLRRIEQGVIEVK